MSEKKFLKFSLDILTIFRPDVVDRNPKLIYQRVGYFTLVILRPNSAHTVVWVNFYEQKTDLCVSTPLNALGIPDHPPSKIDPARIAQKCLNRVRHALKRIPTKFEPDRRGSTCIPPRVAWHTGSSQKILGPVCQATPGGRKIDPLQMP